MSTGFSVSALDHERQEGIVYLSIVALESIGHYRSL